MGQLGGSPIHETGSHSLEAAARFAIAVLEGQVTSQGREWHPKLAYTALKYLEQNLPVEGC